jgi:DNA-binding transcriptional LysR family regulator
MGFLAGFRIANPGCEITLVEGPPPRLTEMLLGGELDIAVMAQPEGAINTRQTRSEPGRFSHSEFMPL